jgi:hypothetical protein
MDLSTIISILDQYYTLTEEDKQLFLKSLGVNEHHEKFCRQLRKQAAGLCLCDEELEKIRKGRPVSKSITLPSGTIITEIIKPLGLNSGEVNDSF